MIFFLIRGIEIDSYRIVEEMTIFKKGIAYSFVNASSNHSIILLSMRIDVSVLVYTCINKFKSIGFTRVFPKFIPFDLKYLLKGVISCDCGVGNSFHGQ